MNVIIPDIESDAFDAWLIRRNPGDMSETDRLSVLLSIIQRLLFTLDQATQTEGRLRNLARVQIDAIPFEHLNAPPEKSTSHTAIHAQYKSYYQAWFASLDWTLDRHDYHSMLTQYLAKPLLLPWLKDCLVANSPARFALQLATVLHISEVRNLVSDSPIGQETSASLVKANTVLLEHLNCEKLIQSDMSGSPVLDFLQQWQLHNSEKDLCSIATTFVDVHQALNGVLPSTLEGIALRRAERKQYAQANNALFKTLVHHVRDDVLQEMDTPLPHDWSG